MIGYNDAMSEDNQPVHLIQPTNGILNLPLADYFGVGHADPAMDALALQILPKLESRGMTMVGHLVTAKDVDLRRTFTSQEIEFLRTQQVEAMNIPRNARVPRWNPPQEAFRF